MEPGCTALEGLQNEVDLETCTIQELFGELKSSANGISSEEAKTRLDNIGLNKLEENKENKIMKFLRLSCNPLTWVMEAAAMMAIALANGEGKPPDWQEFLGIVMLLLINSTISFIEENNASNVVATLMARVPQKAWVRRDSQWSEVDASMLVPGDVIKIKLGNIVAADVCLLGADGDGHQLEIDQSALTGESSPVSKGPGDRVYSGSICKNGEIDAIVYLTGVNTLHKDIAHDFAYVNKKRHFQKVLTAIGNICIYTIGVGMLIEIIVMYPIQKRSYRSGINNLLVLLIGGIPIAMPTVLSFTLAVGSHRLSQQGAITKNMAVIEEMAGMDVLCSDITGTLSLKDLTMEKNLVKVIGAGVSVETVLLAAQAAQLINQDAIDPVILGALPTPEEARAEIQEIHSHPTPFTYTDNWGRIYRAIKGAPEEILNRVDNEPAIQKTVSVTVDSFAANHMLSLAVAHQEVLDRSIESPWVFLGLIPLSDSPRAMSIRRALNMGLQVKLITGDDLGIAKKTRILLGMGGKIFPSYAISGPQRALSADSMIEEADGFAGVFPEHKREIVTRLQARKHTCGITGNGVNDAPSLKIADIGIAVPHATDAARDASDIVLTEPGLDVIISAALTCRAIFQRMKNYATYAVSITVRVVLGFVLLELIWKLDFPPFMVLIIAILNEGTVIAMAKDRVKPSPVPESWKLREILAMGTALGSYLAIITAVFVWTVLETNFFPSTFGVATLQRDSPDYVKKIASAVFLQMSSSSQSLIFVTRARSWSFIERPGFLPVLAFLSAQTVATVIAVYGNWEFAAIHGIGWRWAGVIWLYNLAFYVPLDGIKLLVKYVRTGKAWDHIVERETAFTRNKRERDRKWAKASRSENNTTPTSVIWSLSIFGGIALGYAVTAPASLVKFKNFINLFWPSIYQDQAMAYETNLKKYTNIRMIFVSTATPIFAGLCVFIAWLISCKWGQKITFLLGSFSYVIGAVLIDIDAIWHTEKARLLISGFCIQGFGVGALSQVIPMIIRDSGTAQMDAINRIFKHSYLVGTTLANIIYYICAHNLRSGWIIPMSVNVFFAVLVSVNGVWLKEPLQPLKPQYHDWTHLLKEPLQENREAQPLKPQYHDWTHFRNRPKIVINTIYQLLTPLVGVGSIVFIGPVLLESIGFTQRQSFLGPLVASLCGLGAFGLSELLLKYYRKRRLPAWASFFVIGVSQIVIWGLFMNDPVKEIHHWEVGEAGVFISMNILAAVGFYLATSPANLTADPYYGKSASIGAAFEASVRLLMTGLMGFLVFFIFGGMRFGAFLFMGCVGLMISLFVLTCVPETYGVADPVNIYDTIWRQHRIWRHFTRDTLQSHNDEDVQV